jgi:hypothetical protein
VAAIENSCHLHSQDLADRVHLVGDTRNPVKKLISAKSQKQEIIPPIYPAQGRALSYLINPRQGVYQMGEVYARS